MAEPKKDDRKTPENQQKTETALREEAILKFWKDNNIFKKSLEKPSPKGEFVFYDGPPFATGLPHSGSLLSSVIKDVIPRYKTMQGFHVERRWGWDCHGLPIESMIEKKLGLKSKKDIEAIGIEKFNEAARSVVLEYVHDWKYYIDRVGRFVDFDNSYKTMDNTFIESVWWGLKQIYEKGKLYEGRKVLMYCPHDETPLAKAEIAQDNSYEDVTEESVVVKFKLKPGQKIAGNDIPENTFILAWTTTPWTLPGNVALAVGNDIAYVSALLSDSGETVILAKERLSALGDISYKEKENWTGRDLLGLEYEPLFAIEKIQSSGRKSHYVVAADFVSTDEGTGVVHTAVMYGEDDFALGQKVDLPMVQLLNPNGTFNTDAPDLIKGKYFKWHQRGFCPVQKGEDAEAFIKKDLSDRNFLFSVENRTHSYPHCYRCNTPLIYNAIPSWFINVQDVKNRLLELNEGIHWVPDHLKSGRFKHIVESAPDWTISRNRYWASPLPIWKNSATGKVVVIGSVEELRARAKKSGNKYFIMRHGEAESNVQGILSTKVDNPHHLTEKGRTQVAATAEELRKEKIDFIITSPFVRTRETAEIVRQVLTLPDSAVVVDDRLHEVNAGVYEGKPVTEFRSALPFRSRMVEAPEGGESLEAVGMRTMACLFDLEKGYAGKNILIISHGSPLLMIEGYANGQDREAIIRNREQVSDLFEQGVYREIPFFPYPHRANFEPDLHRPYIDQVELLDDDGTPLTRIPEVVDCWVESGSMPFASNHYPFENGEYFDNHFPGDFIAEYIAQTRTWFYYMHVMGVEIFNKQAFKAVVSTGTILAADGSKMSKSKMNYTDPLVNLDLYGADAFRAYLMGSVVMQAEDLRFLDPDLRDVHNRLIQILFNSFKFFEMQAEGVDIPPKVGKNSNVLDLWIQSRLASTGQAITHSLDRFDTVGATKAIKEFVLDLSTWYIRRSRDRFKGEDQNDRLAALQTSKEVFLTLSKYIAPIMPFIAETIYKGAGGTLESVHLESWPEARLIDADIIELMEASREAVSHALEARAASGIKIRQPLPALIIKDERLIEQEAYLAVIRDEVNVKQIIFDPNQELPAVLDTKLTDELIEEGAVREMIRLIQQTRKNLGLATKDQVKLLVNASENGQVFVNRHRAELEGTAGVSIIEFLPLDEAVPTIQLYGEAMQFVVLPIEK